MQPSGLSSLIFLVIIAIWAAYLFQHWVSRREHLATARSVDRFSEAMRVLDRRLPLAAPDLPAQRPRSYSLRATGHSRTDAVAPQVTTSNASMGSARGVRHVSISDAVATSASGVRARSRRAARSTSTRRVGLSARRIRGLSLFASLSLAVIASPLAAFSVLPWWAVLVTVAVLLAELPLLRHAAVSDRAARRVRGTARRPQTTRPPYSAPVDPGFVDATDRSEEVASATRPPAEADPSGWAPVPVPPPTYTLKARAKSPDSVPVAVTGSERAQPLMFDGFADAGQLHELQDRRRVAGA